METHNLEEITRLLQSRPELANSDITWGDNGKNIARPLHYISDLVFMHMLEEQQAISIAEILLGYGAKLDRQDIKGDTPLIAATSLGTEDLALRLLSMNADFKVAGLFGATALHWAALMGQDRLVEALLHMKADAMLKDTSNHGTPLDWAVYGWKHDDVPAKKNRQPVCAALLVSVGSPVTGAMLAQLDQETDSLMFTVLEPDIIEEKKQKKKKS